MGDVIVGRFITKYDIPAEQVFKGAGEAKLKSAVIMGFDENGEFYFASSVANGGEIFWLMELAKKKLLEVFE